MHSTLKPCSRIRLCNRRLPRRCCPRSPSSCRPREGRGYDGRPNRGTPRRLSGQHHYDRLPVPCTCTPGERLFLVHVTFLPAMQRPAAKNAYHASRAVFHNSLENHCRSSIDASSHLPSLSLALNMSLPIGCSYHLVGRTRVRATCRCQGSCRGATNHCRRSRCEEGEEAVASCCRGSRIARRCHPLAPTPAQTSVSLGLWGRS